MRKTTERSFSSGLRHRRDYAGLVDVFGAGEGNAASCRAKTEGELDEAVARAVSHDGMSLIEVVIDRDDCSRNLLEWGSHVARNNARPPPFR